MNFQPTHCLHLQYLNTDAVPYAIFNIAVYVSPVANWQWLANPYIMKIV